MHRFHNESGSGASSSLGLIAFALAALVALAIPALAAAHPQVYSLTPKKQDTGIKNPCTFENDEAGTCVVDGTVRYAIANDGYPRTLTETSGSDNPGHGIINYQLRARKLRSGAVVISGRTDSALPGRLLLLGANDVQPTATKKAGGARFAFRFGPGRLAPGRYEVVYVAARGRAERSTSNPVRLR